MKGFRNKSAFTLVEMIVCIAIVFILASLVLTVSRAIDRQGKERLTRVTISICIAALEQFAEYKYTFYSSDYEQLSFPPDFNGFTNRELLMEARNHFGRRVMIYGHYEYEQIYDPNYSGCSVMYFFLNQVPECKSILSKIDSSLVTNLDENDQPMMISVDNVEQPFFRILDGWGKTLRYDYYDEWSSLPDPDLKRSFPLITSAGPDGKFGTADDITSR